MTLDESWFRARGLELRALCHARARVERGQDTDWPGEVDRLYRACRYDEDRPSVDGPGGY